MEGTDEEWRSPRGARLRSGHPVTKAAFAAVGKRWPGRWGFDELTDELTVATGGPRDAVATVLAGVLWESFLTGMVDAWPDRESFATSVSEKPVSSALARYQLSRGTSCVTLLHGTLTVGDAAGRELIRLLDGTRDRNAIITAMACSPAITSQSGDPERRRALATESVTSGLDHLAILGLLSA